MQEVNQLYRVFINLLKIAKIDFKVHSDLDSFTIAASDLNRVIGLLTKLNFTKKSTNIWTKDTVKVQFILETNTQIYAVAFLGLTETFGISQLMKTLSG